MLERGLRAAGYRTGRYTSPHLVNLTERIAIDGRPISAADLEHLAGRVRAAAERLATPPTFFEATTARRAGGLSRRGRRRRRARSRARRPARRDQRRRRPRRRITSIDFDHEAYLGDTIEAIARGEGWRDQARRDRGPGRRTPRRCRRRPARRANGRARATSSRPRASTVDVTMARWARRDLALVTPRGYVRDLTLALRGRHQVANAVAASACSRRSRPTG